MFNNFLDKALSLVYPEKCPFCGTIVESKEACCSVCFQKLCDTGKVQILSDDGDNHIVRCFSSLNYKGDVSKAICKFKFNGYRSYDRRFSILMNSKIQQYFRDDYFDVVTSVPLLFKRRIIRGYNQSKLLGAKVARKLDVPYIELIKKVKDNAPQHMLCAKERANNVFGVYKIYEQKESYIKGKKILLCDDIVTTGSTLKECSKELLNSGAKEVSCITIAWA